MRSSYPPAEETHTGAYVAANANANVANEVMMHSSTPPERLTDNVEVMEVANAAGTQQ